MKIALRLAKMGGEKVFPNPQVGCVIVKDNKIVGQGWHEYFGGPHAEINALKQAGKNAVGATMYVTLEPCNHFGKTPPCSDAIIRAGVKKVIVAAKDPNKKTSGQSIKKFKKYGIEVVTGINESEALALNRKYCASINKVKPYVILKMAVTLDGKIASRTGDSKWITGKLSRQYVHKLRTRMDGVLVGSGTVRNDNPHLTSHGCGKNPARIIVDPCLKTPVDSNVFDKKSIAIFVYDPGKIENVPKYFSSNNSVIMLPVKSEKGRINFNKIIRKLSEMCINNILIEGGGETAAFALEDGIVNEVNIFIAPKIAGGRNAPSPVGGTGVDSIKNCLKIKNAAVKKIGEDFLFKGYL